MHPSPRRLIAVTIASAAVVTLPAFTPPLRSHDVRVVSETRIALAASWSPQQQAVLDDFARGGLAEVLRVQGTSRLTHPDQVQIINDFFEGGVIQTEGRRWIGLFADPQQQAFLTDLLTGGVVQIVRNRLLDSTSDPSARAAITAFFPDEITDYRGGPITMLQRRLIAAAKGNQFVIAVINAVIDNPVTLTIRRLIGGGPIIGTPLPDLPPLEPVASTSGAAPLATEDPEPAERSKTPTESVAIQSDSTNSRAELTPAEITTAGAVTERAAAAVDEAADEVGETAESPETAEPTETTPTADTTDVLKTGNKVSPTTLAPSAARPSGPDGWGVFGQVVDDVATSLAGVAAPAAPTAPASAGDATQSSDSDSGDSGGRPAA